MPPDRRKSASGRSRRRRTAEEARAAILDAAEAHLVHAGPAGVRLQEVAAEVGVSHPTILHHFGSREELIRAVVDRALGAMQHDLLSALASSEPSDTSAMALLERTASALEGRGYGRLIAWLSLSEYDLPPMAQRLRELADVVHEKRRARSEVDAPAAEDSLFIVLLCTLVLTAESVIGKPVYKSAGLGDDPRARERFHGWLARRLIDLTERR